MFFSVLLCLLKFSTFAKTHINAMYNMYKYTILTSNQFNFGISKYYQTISQWNKNCSTSNYTDYIHLIHIICDNYSVDISTYFSTFTY